MEIIFRVASAAVLLAATAMAVFSSKAVMLYSLPILVCLSVVIEWILHPSLTSSEKRPMLWYARSHLALFAVATLPVAVAQFSQLWLAHDLPLPWPHPALVVLTQLQAPPVWLTAAACFLLGNAYLARMPNGVPLPMRLAVLYSIASVGTICIAIWPWDLLESYFSVRQIWTVHGANLLFIGVFGGLWLRWHRRATQRRAMLFAVMLYVWLFSYAFPFFIIE